MNFEEKVRIKMNKYTTLFKKQYRRKEYSLKLWLDGHGE